MPSDCRSLKRRGEFDLEVFETGLKSVFECYSKAEIDAEIVLKALKIHGIDCILYSIALKNDMKFASLDSEHILLCGCLVLRFEPKALPFRMGISTDAVDTASRKNAFSVHVSNCYRT